MIIAVHGATGLQGAPVVRQLLAQSHEVRALARNPHHAPAGAHPTPVDLADPASLAAAYRGADVVVVQFPVIFSEVILAQADAILKALSGNKVEHVIFNTSAGIQRTETGHPFLDARFRLIRDLPELAPTVSVLGPAALYNEVLADPWTVAGNEIRHPLPPELALPWVAAEDVATAIGELLTEPVSAQLIGGPEDLTGFQVAQVLSAVLGRELRWRTTEIEEFRELMTPHLGAEVAAGVAGSYTAVTADTMDPALVRRGTTSLRDWAERWPWAAV
ncbi:NAD(P)H-binding protein [Crossiella sp. SN42]|uniref:SDR family oxidoreductase n=1 Tax=Crossiella sp. SN42 TaxID=2944808 RepID=UPI00207CEADC|nr:NAD(P)H-binding protein [Crossiella sp. SN42]MCO1574480.1 NAD(P)H-binding protein [Crossiella sp. SN42]